MAGTTLRLKSETAISLSSDRDTDVQDLVQRLARIDERLNQLGERALAPITALYQQIRAQNSSPAPKQSNDSSLVTVTWFPWSNPRDTDLTTSGAEEAVDDDNEAEEVVDLGMEDEASDETVAEVLGEVTLGAEMDIPLTQEDIPHRKEAEDVWCRALQEDVDHYSQTDQDLSLIHI